MNINGYRSKSESIKQLIQENNIDILLLTETKVYSKTAVRIEGYQVFPAVRSKGNGGRPFGCGKAWFVFRVND